MNNEKESADEPVTTRLYPLSPAWMTALFYLGLLVWTVVLLVLALDWSWQNRLFPITLTGLAIILIAVQLFLIYFRDHLSGLVPSTSETGSDKVDIEQDTGFKGRVGRERERHELIIIGWVITLPILLNVIGFLYTIPIYTFIFIWYYLRDVRTAILASVVATGVVYTLFVQVLGIQLPEGVIFIL